MLSGHCRRASSILKFHSPAVFILALGAASLLLNVQQIFGQQSPSAQLKPPFVGPVQKTTPPAIGWRGATGTTKRPASSTPNSDQPVTPPFRFLGWNYAKTRGGSYLQHFLRNNARVAPQSVNGSELSKGNNSKLPNTSALAVATPPVPGFLTRPPLPAGFLPTGVVTGDFDGDGHVDWVVSNGGSNNLWFYHSNGDGTASLPIIIPLQGQTPVAIATGSLRNNGKLDLIVAEADSGTVEVLLGNGDGTFASGPLLSLPVPPTTVAVADFDNNGTLGILAGLQSGAVTGPLALFRGDGAGHFASPIIAPENPLSVPPIIVSLVVADLNNDGYPDVLLVDASGDTAADSYVNQKNGTFSFVQQVAAGAVDLGISDLSIAAGDVNGDGCPDAVVMDTLGDAALYRGKCDGTFENNRVGGLVPEFGVGDQAQDVMLADLNGDGNLDLVTSGVPIGTIQGEIPGNLVSVLFGDGTGNFGAVHAFAGDPAMVSFSLADLIGNGRLDLVSANQDSDSATVFLNDGTGSFGGPQGGYVGYLIAGNNGGTTNPAIDNEFLAVDLNGDGKKDLAWIEFPPFGTGSENLAVALNDGTGKFGTPVIYPIPATVNLPPGDFKFADFRNTGHMDFLAVGSGFTPGDDFILFAPNNGNGTFGTPVLTSLSNAQFVLGVGDFNKDGKLDFATANVGPGGFQLNVFLGNGDGTFTPGQTIFLGADQDFSVPEAIYVGDFNRDGKLDVLVWVNSSGPSTRNLYEVFGNGDGTFGSPRVVLSNLGFFAMADVNHDGVLDIIEVAGAEITEPNQSPGFAIYLAQPDGTFLLSHTYQPYSGVDANFIFSGPIEPAYQQPVVADFNGDGNPDIAVFQRYPSNFTTTGPTQLFLQILMGNGDGTFTPSFNGLQFHRANGPQQAVDLNGDGRADLLEFDQFTSSYQVTPAGPGPAFQIQMKSDPVVAANGGVLLTLSVPSATSTSLTLTASDPAIQIPSSVQIPAGAISQEVDFNIGAAFDSSHVFSIRAQLGAESESAFSSKAGPALNAGFQISVGGPESAVPGGFTGNYGITGISTGGYATSVQLTCQGLPATATCQFGANPLTIPSDNLGQATLFVNVAPNAVGGSFPFVINATDGTFSQQLNATLNIGDFAISFPSPSQTALPGESISYIVAVGSMNGFNQDVNMSCGNLPPGITCSLGTSVVSLSPTGSQTAVNVQVSNAVPQGTYSFTLTGVSGPISHSRTAQVVVGGLSASFTQTSVTIQLFGNTNIPFTIQSLNSFTGPVSFACQGAPTGTSCAFTPVQIDMLAANGSANSALSISVEVKPSTGPNPGTSTVHSFPSRSTIGAEAAFLFFALSLVWMSRLRKFGISGPVRRACCFVALLVLAGGMVSCGGGSAPVGGGGGGGGGSTPATFSVTILGQSGPGGVVSLGTITITVP